MEPPVVQPAERRTQEEVAAEMRRILGMEPAPPRTAPPPPPRREARSPEKPPQPLQPRTLGQLAVHVDPHVGEKIRGLKAPASGAVGRSELGQLGGRGRERQRRAFRHGASVVDLDHLTRAIVMREILDPPLALRPSFDRPA
jgi:hypothetical protein